MKNTLWWSKTFKRDAWFDLRDLFEDDFLRAGSPPAMMYFSKTCLAPTDRSLYWSASGAEGLVVKLSGLQACKATKAGGTSYWSSRPFRRIF